MAYVLADLTGVQLDELGAAVYAERKRRVIANVSNYPVPECIPLVNVVYGIKRYRQQTGLSLAESKWIVEHYMEQANGKAKSGQSVPQTSI